MSFTIPSDADPDLCGAVPVIKAGDERFIRAALPLNRRLKRIFEFKRQLDRV